MFFGETVFVESRGKREKNKISPEQKKLFVLHNS